MLVSYSPSNLYNFRMDTVTLFEESGGVRKAVKLRRCLSCSSCKKSVHLFSFSRTLSGQPALCQDLSSRFYTQASYYRWTTLISNTNDRSTLTILSLTVKATFHLKTGTEIASKAEEVVEVYAETKRQYSNIGSRKRHICNGMISSLCGNAKLLQTLLRSSRTRFYFGNIFFQLDFYYELHDSPSKKHESLLE